MGVEKCTWRWWVVIVRGCSAAPRAVEIPTPLAMPTVSIASSVKKRRLRRVCEGSEWERVAEIRGTRDAGLFERITEDRKDIDCGAERMGERLTKR